MPELLRFTKSRILVLMLLTAVGCEARPPAPTDRVPIESSNKRGIHLLLDDGRGAWPPDVWAEHVRYAREAVGEWGYVTQLVRSDDLDRAKWQQFMDLCADLHLTPILRLATTFNEDGGMWTAPPAGIQGQYQGLAGRYARFVSSLDWPTEQPIVIVGNEPNHGNEWGGTPDPAAYARFLIATADAIHRSEPAAIVLNAGLDPYAPHSNGVPMADGFVYMDAETFLDEMIAAEPDVFSHIDAWSSHSYPMGPFAAPPWEQTYARNVLNGASNPAHRAPPPGVANRGINGYKWELWKLSTYGIEGLPVFITETGWRHAEAADSASLDGGGVYPGVATAATYLELAFFGNDGRYPDYPEDGWTPWADDPRVVAVTPFALNGRPVEWSHTNWLRMSDQGEVLGAYPLIDVLAADNP